MIANRRAVPVASQGGTDLKDPHLYVSEEFHKALLQIRREQPVYWNSEANSAGFWAVTRYEDATRVLEDPETFSAAIENGGIRIFDAADVNADPRPHLLAMDPPEHTQLRRALLPLFAPQTVAAREETIRRRANRLIDNFQDAGRIDFVESFAQPLTLGLLTDLLDVPQGDADRLLKWSNAFVGDDDEDFQMSLDFRQECVIEMDIYAKELYHVRKSGAGSDFVSLISTAQIGGKELDIETYTSNFAAFIIAGNETTRHALSAGVLALSAFPDEKAKLVADPSLTASAVKEVVRWATPLMHVRRTAMKDAAIGSQQIKKGDKVVVWYVSANRDEEQWPQSMRFDVSRFNAGAATPHLAFGHGPHYCLGWRLAELQIRITIEEFIRRLPDFRVADPVRRLQSNFIGGIKSLPLIFTPRHAREGTSATG